MWHINKDSKSSISYIKTIHSNLVL